MKAQSESADNLTTIMIQIITQGTFMGINPWLNSKKISLAQFLLMAWLKNSEDTNMRDVSEKMAHSSAAATGLGDKLEEKGLAQRIRIDPEDRRKVTLRLTPHGVEIVNEGLKNLGELIQKFTAA